MTHAFITTGTKLLPPKRTYGVEKVLLVDQNGPCEIHSLMFLLFKAELVLT